MKKKQYIFTNSFILSGVMISSCTLLAVTVQTSCADSPGNDDNIEYLKSLNIEDLLQTEITSVSKKPEKLADAAAAVFVITSEDLKRTGARNIPEALRMVPGLQVAQIDASKWAISARGFSDYFSNKLLVLIDGRSVYTPLFSGVFWDVQDTQIGDIERIEVIRGPGATLWGANAVNGVINIITKSADQTQGILVEAGSGSHQPYSIATRFGGQISNHGHYRIYAKGDDYSEFAHENGEDAHDSWQKQQAGFRTDLQDDSGNSLTVQGDIYDGKADVAYDFPGLVATSRLEDTMDFTGANLIARWQHEHADGTVMSLQAYYDYTDRAAVITEEIRKTFDLDFQYRWQATRLQEITWGLGYRVSSDDIETTMFTDLNPSSKTDHLYSAFIQDEIVLCEDTWWLTLGSKFEHNDYSGFEYQPNVRLRWKPTEQQTFWSSISRAVRTPSRTDHDLRVNTFLHVDQLGNRYLGSINGDRDFEPEELIAYEVGHRIAPTATFSIDTAIFYNNYKNLRSVNIGATTVEMFNGAPHFTFPRYFANELSGETYGIELLVSWQPVSSWKISAGYSFLQSSLEGTNGTTVVWEEQQFEEDDFAEHQIQLRSYLDLPAGFSFDTEVYYVSDLSGREIDSYVRLDLRLGWQVNENVSVSVSGENLTDSQKNEYGDSTNLLASEVPRQVFAKLTWNY